VRVEAQRWIGDDPETGSIESDPGQREHRGDVHVRGKVRHAFARRAIEKRDRPDKTIEVDAGPLDERSCELIKIGISLGGGLESALKSHVRRARHAGATIEEIEQAISLGMTSMGWARTVAAWRWAHDQLQRDTDESE